MPIVELDLETKSRIDIKEAGAGKYASDPSTRILCTCWAVDNGPVQGLMGDQAPEILFDYVKKGYTFSAFNAIFEIMIWKYRWPDLPLPKFICTRSLVAAHGLPQTLDRACKALNIGMAKDIEGKRLINTYSTPRLNGEFNELKGPDAKAMLQYCAKDVILSRRIRQRLPALTAEEQKVYDWTVDANLRGIVIDTQLATEAEGIASSLQAVGNKELGDLTGGKIFSVSQIQRIRNYLSEEYGVLTESLDKEAIEELLSQDNIPTDARRILELRRDLSQTSVKKFQRARLSVCDDGRVRDTLIYHGAATGRWCMPGEAEVLTPQGWVRLDMWKGGDLLRWAPHVEGHSTPGYFHWEKDAVVHGFPYAGPMIQIDHRNIKGLFTPDHRFPVYNKRQDFHIRTAEKLASGDYIPVSGNSLGVRSTASDIHTRFWVMLQADGHIIAGGSVRFHFKKLRKIERCVALLTEAGIKYTRRQYSCGCVIRVLKRDLPKGWGVKHFSNALLTHNPKVFLDEIPYWDGSRDLENSKQGFEYTSTCLSDAEWVVTMAHLTGFAASINARRRVSDRWKPAYRVYVRNLDRVQIRKSHLKKVLYAGHVYCPKTHSGYFLCRYQGTVFVSGNTSQVVQFQNLPKYAVPDMDTALALIKTKDAELFDFAYAQPMLTLSGCIRGLVLPSPGKKLAVVDYNAIEARILMWAAGQEDAVDDFHKGRDIYVEMAREIYRNKNLTKADKAERMLGKQTVLGCGYQMGAIKFQATCEGYGIDLGEKTEYVEREDKKTKETIRIRYSPLAKRAVETYRERFPAVPQFWYGMQNAAENCVRNNRPASYRGFTFFREREFLYMQLPSGRRLAYHRPGVDKDGLYYYAEDRTTFQYTKRRTYGGRLVENAIQATARDILAHGILKLEENGFPVILTVHDENVVEIEEGYEPALAAIIYNMCDLPKWTEGCPITAEGFITERYRKG